MLRWYFSYGFVDDFVDRLLEELNQQSLLAPTNTGKIKSVAKHQQRTEQALGFLMARIERFHREQKLNFFQRGRLSQRLQDALLRRDFSAEFAKEVAVTVIRACA